MSHHADRIMEMETFRSRFRSATPKAQEFCFAFLRGGALSENPTLDERAGKVLALLAPTRWSYPALEHDDDEEEVD